MTCFGGSSAIASLPISDNPDDQPDENAPDDGMEQVGTGSGVAHGSGRKNGYILTNKPPLPAAPARWSSTLSMGAP